MPLYDKPEDMGEYLFRIVDNMGKTADRYTVIFSDGDYIGMSGAPTHPQGVSMWGERIDVQGVAERVESGEDVDLQLGDLPEDLRLHIMERVNTAWADCLAAIEAMPLTPREAVKGNDGNHDSGGVGVYRTGGGYYVHREGERAESDLGPFDTAAQAMRNTMPEHYSLSGPEYHSSADPSSLNPCQPKGYDTQLPQFYTCGTCDHYHRKGYLDDCRNDEERFTADELDEKFGAEGWEEIDPETDEFDPSSADKWECPGVQAADNLSTGALLAAADEGKNLSHSRTVWALGRAARRADLVKVGDRLDFESDPIADPNGDDPHFPYEYANVEGVKKEGDVIVLSTSQGCFGFPPDHMIDVDPEQDENHAGG